MSLTTRVTHRWLARVFTGAAIALATASAAADPQRDTAEKRLAFEAATIKLAVPDAVRNSVAPTSPNRLYIPSMTLTALIYAAYGDGGFNTSMRVTGGPDWINRTTFAVEGVASGQPTPRQLRLMLQTLLAERFALKIRDVTETPDSVGAGGGPKRRDPRSKGHEVGWHLPAGDARAVSPSATSAVAEDRGQVRGRAGFGG